MFIYRPASQVVPHTHCHERSKPHTHCCLPRRFTHIMCVLVVWSGLGHGFCRSAHLPLVHLREVFMSCSQRTGELRKKRRGKEFRKGSVEVKSFSKYSPWESSSRAQWQKPSNHGLTESLLISLVADLCSGGEMAVLPLL